MYSEKKLAHRCWLDVKNLRGLARLILRSPFACKKLPRSVQDVIREMLRELDKYDLEVLVKGQQQEEKRHV